MIVLRTILLMLLCLFTLNVLITGHLPRVQWTGSSFNDNKPRNFGGPIRPSQ